MTLKGDGNPNDDDLIVFSLTSSLSSPEDDASDNRPSLRETSPDRKVGSVPSSLAVEEVAPEIPITFL